MANGDSIVTITAREKESFCGKKNVLQTYWTSLKSDYETKVINLLNGLTISCSSCLTISK